MIAELTIGQELLLVAIGALLGGVMTWFAQHRLDAARAKREQRSHEAAEAKSATSVVRVLRNRLDSTRSTLEALNSEWPAGEEFALGLKDSQFRTLEGRLDGPAWAALVEAQAHLESIQIRRSLDARNEGQYPPDGKIGTQLVELAQASLVRAERELARLDR